MEKFSYDKEKTVEPYCANVSNINISAQDRSNISAPVLSNINVTGNISITNYFPGATGPAAEITDTSSLINDYKRSLLSQYAYITEYTSRAGEEVLLNDRYTELLIVQKHREKKEREEELCSRGERFFSTRTNKRNQNISLDQLFSPENNPHKETPRAVILQGDSGSGKSITTQKIVLDWASGKLYAGIFHVVFHLRCKELNCLSGEISLMELLDCSLTLNEIGQILKNTSQKILFIIDGFDELILPAPKESLPPKSDIKAPPWTIILSLLKGRMMPESFLLVTTRSTAVDRLEKVLKKPQCFTEIMGFSEEGVTEYFQKFFEDEEFSKQVYDQVKQHEMLYTACFMPVICWTTCTIFKKNGKDRVATSELTTTTSIFVDFVFTLMRHHSSINQDEQFDILKSLGQLAESGTPKRQVLFHKSSLPKSISDSPSIPFLYTFRHQERTYLKEMFSFMHLSFQEFFTALLYMLTDKAEAKIKVKELLELVGNGRHNDHLLPVIRFLFGLSNKKVSRFFKQQRSTSSVIRAQLEKWISKVILKNVMVTFYMSEFILHCLYELQDREILRNVMKLWEKSGIRIQWSLKGVDCHVVNYCLEDNKHIHSMQLRCTDKNLEIIHSALCRCETLWLVFDSISDANVDLLTSALGKGKNVDHLTFKDGAFSNQSVKKLLKTLSEQKSVGNIRLSVRSINYTNADLIMNFLIDEMMGRQFSICIAGQAENTKESLCSEFTMANNNNSFCLTVGHSDGDQGETLNDHGFCYHQAFSKISFTISAFSAISIIDWKDFLKISHKLRGFSKLNNAEFGESVDSLLSFLSSVPDLRELDVRAEHLTDIWTSRILSYIQNNPKISHITFHVSSLILSSEERICSTFSASRKAYEPCKMHTSERNNPSLTLAMDRWAHDIAYSSSRKSANSNLQDIPALVKLILSFPPLEGSNVIWELLFKKLYQLIRLTEKCPELDEHIDSLLLFLHSVPDLKEVKLWINSLNESWAAGLVSFFLSCPSLHHLQLNTHMLPGSDVGSLGMMRKDGVMLSVGCNHVNFLEDCCDIDPFEPPVHKVLPCFTITVTDDCVNKNTDWKKFFHIYNQLKEWTDYCPEYDESVSRLLSGLHSVSGLKGTELMFRFMTVDGASRVLDLIHTNPSLTAIDFLAAMRPETSEINYRGTYRHTISRKCESEEDSDSDRQKGFWFQTERHMDSDEDSMSSFLSVSSNEPRLCLKCSGSSLESPLSNIVLTLSENSVKTTDWKTFLHAYNQCKGIAMRSPRFDESVDGLLSSLHSVSGLNQVNLMTESLTESWAPKILSLCNTCPSLHNVCLCSERDSLLNACSSLSVTRNIRNSTMTVDIQSAHDKEVRTIPSFISFTAPCSEITKLDGQELLQTLDLLKGLEEKSSEHEEYVEDVISLISLPGLQSVELEIRHLTESWARRILSLSKVCPSLQEIRCDCTEGGGLLLDEGLRILQSSQMDSECTLIITGIRCSKATDECTEIMLNTSTLPCNEKVTLTLCRSSLSHKTL